MSLQFAVAGTASELKCCYLMQRRKERIHRKSVFTTRVFGTIKKNKHIVYLMINFGAVGELQANLEPVTRMILYCIDVLITSFNLLHVACVGEIFIEMSSSVTEKSSTMLL